MNFLIDNVYYSLDSNSFTATVGNNQNNKNLPENLNIPSTVKHEEKTYKVTSISNAAFYKVTTIKSLTLNENLLKIGDSGFDQCYMTIETLEFPSSLRELGHHSFAVNDIKRVKISPYISQIGNCPFGYNHELESIEVDPKNPFFCKERTTIVSFNRVACWINIPEFKLNLQIGRVINLNLAIPINKGINIAATTKGSLV